MANSSKGSDVAGGRFITLEGSEGAGKSSNLQAVCDALDVHNLAYVVTREPGGTPLAESIRELMLAPREEPVHPTTELLLVFAARQQHVTNVIQPALQRGDWVVCDRFTDATYAYQGYGRGLDLGQIETLEQWVQSTLRPDLTLYLDLPPEIGAQRIAERAQDRLEQQQLSFFEAVREGYLARCRAGTHMRIIDAQPPLNEVTAAVADVIHEFVAECSQ